MKLLIGGSPCTHWSIAQKSHRETEPTGLGWELFKNYLIAREKFKPDFFLYENNKSMAPAIRKQITKELGVEPILINSALVSAQNRQRLYWTNIPSVTQPEDLGLLLRDILEGVSPDGDPVCINPTSSGKSRTVDARMGKLESNLIPRLNNPNPAKQQHDCIVEPINTTKDGKAYALKAQYSKSAATDMTRGGGAHYPASGVAIPVNVTADGKAHCLRATCYKDGIRNMVMTKIDRKTCVAEPVRIGCYPSPDGTIKNGQGMRIYSVDGKAVTQAASSGGLGSTTGLYAVPAIPGVDCKSYQVFPVASGEITVRGNQYPIDLPDGHYIIRKLTVTECKRLQTVPESYQFPVSPTQAYKMLGNGWTVDVIAHILGHIPRIAMEPLEVLSMYDGMSCGHIALDRLGANVTKYYATEIDKYAVQTTMANYPDTIQLGDAFDVRRDDWKLPEA